RCYHASGSDSRNQAFSPTTSALPEECQRPPSCEHCESFAVHRDAVGELTCQTCDTESHLPMQSQREKITLRRPVPGMKAGGIYARGIGPKKFATSVFCKTLQLLRIRMRTVTARFSISCMSCAFLLDTGQG